MARPLPLSCLLFWALALVSACAPPGDAADHRAARAVCGLVPDEAAATGLLDDGRLPVPLSAACVARLRADLGVDGDSFAAPAGPVGVVDGPHDALMAAAWLLLAADLGEVGPLLRDPAAPPWGGAALADEADRLGLPDDAPAAALFYGWVTARVDAVVLDDSLSGVTAVYDRPTRRVLLEPVEGLAASPPWLASALVHEAAHLPSPGHDPCPDDPGPAACDADLSGPYGLQLWFLERMVGGLDTSTEWGARSCQDAERGRRAACAMVADNSNGPLCTRALDCG